MKSRLVLPLALAVALPLGAQATRPDSTKPAAKPAPAKVVHDTIYALAVDSTKYPDDDAVFLLDDGELRYEADGTGSETFRQVVQVLREDAVERYAEYSFGYAPDHQKLKVNWIRVVKPDGTVISDGPAQEQDADIPAEMGAPVYSNRKLKRITLSGVAPGTLVDYSYTTEELKPWRPGDFFQTWSITTGLPVRRSRLLLDVPSGVKPHVWEQNLPTPRRETAAKGRTVYAWTARDVATVKGEPFAADSNGFYAHLALSSPGTWGDVARWYAGLARDRYAIAPEVEKKLAQVTAGARTLDDSIRAVHRWIAQDVRYVSLSLGIGGYQPRSPAEVLSTGFGDCKDKATLFVAAMKRFGLTAYPVLLSSGGDVRRELPSISQFNHAIAALDRGGKRTYVDLTADLVPFGSLPPGIQGAFALVVHPDGSSEEVTLPADPLDTNRAVRVLSGAVGADGLFDGRYEETVGGAQQYSLRSLFSSPIDTATRAKLERSLATRIFPGASGDSLAAFNGKDFAAVPRVSMRLHQGRALRHQGGVDMLVIPFGSLASFTGIADELAARGPRRFPIAVEEVVGKVTWVNEMRVTLPEGWRARLPDAVSASSVFGSYRAEYRQEGRDVIVRREMRGAPKGVLPPDRIGELIDWLRAVGKDDAEFVVVEKK